MSETSNKPIVSIRRLSKAFSGVRALENVQFDLLPGEVHALMGENGAGKSTLMKILAGVYQRDNGEILLDGKAVDITSPRSAQAHGICIVHQELNLMNHLSAAQNIFIGREPRKHMGVFVDEDALNRQASAIFERMHLKLDPRTPVGELTVAKQQMVEIAKALSFDSRVLIMDEPTAALNSAEVADLFRIIRQLRGNGVGIAYISHKMDELQQIADRVTVMRDGQYIDTVPMATTSVDRIINMMVGREIGDVSNHAPDTSGNEVALEVRGLNRGKAIRNVSFTLRKGEILGFAGLMGAGRTEVARAVFGADRIDSGEILVHGKKAAIRSPEDAVAHGVGYLSEDRKHFGLATGLDVETNIVMSSLKRFLSFGGFVDEARTRTTAESYVKQLQIKTPSVEKQVKLLSGGNQQKIVIAKWLLRDCDILFFDEPTRGIDVGAKSEIYKLLNALAEQGKAIRNVSFTLRKGEILGFAGLMGAGRTEVARAVFGADRIDSGEILVHGKKAAIRSPEDAVAHGVGYLSEDRKHFGLATGLDVETNIVMSSLKRFLSFGGFVDEARTRTTAESYVKQLQIKTPSVEKQVKLLSGGNQQKIVIAKWLLRDCDILFFDEPTRGIDVGAKSEIYKLLNALAEQGKAIVMISSELPEVLRMSHRILVMCEGRITGELSGHDATQEKVMQLATQRDTETAAA